MISGHLKKSNEEILLIEKFICWVFSKQPDLTVNQHPVKPFPAIYSYLKEIGCHFWEVMALVNQDDHLGLSIFEGGSCMPKRDHRYVGSEAVQDGSSVSFQFTIPLSRLDKSSAWTVP